MARGELEVLDRRLDHHRGAPLDRAVARGDEFDARGARDFDSSRLGTGVAAPVENEDEEQNDGHDGAEHGEDWVLAAHGSRNITYSSALR